MSIPALVGEPAELYMTITVTRKKDGSKETYQMVGHSTVDEAEALGAVKKEPTETKKE